MTPHRRRNPLTGEWILVSPQRTERPWLGQIDPPLSVQRPPYDPSCYLCPGNKRAGGAVNPAYVNTYVFDNDYPALTHRANPAGPPAHPLLQFRVEPGCCRVICFSPRHDLTLAQMEVAEMRGVIDTWRNEVTELSRQYHWVQVFENKGEIMGCSNPHPHGQIWAQSNRPNEAEKEDRAQRDYFEAHRAPLLVDYAELEAAAAHRIVLANDHWVVVVPFWAVWPFETLLLPRRPVPHLPQLETASCHALAAILRELLVKYDNLFGVSFPYSMGWHGAPGAGDDQPHWQLHAHFYPPLLRSATVKKFMVGYEMLAEAQRDLTAEEAAARLRSVTSDRTGVA
ncbi:MAG: UDP-glucose--hexose-1-phosphate uridylyltransferase [Nitrospirae bacterium]|nr:UDP-glucose--hexose-1-phosphate uridylyltransferase [Nitrospirota bacterium]